MSDERIKSYIEIVKDVTGVLVWLSPVGVMGWLAVAAEIENSGGSWQGLGGFRYERDGVSGQGFGVVVTLPRSARLAKIITGDVQDEKRIDDGSKAD